MIVLEFLPEVDAASIGQDDIAYQDIEALVLGEHGDSMVPIWSSASVNGLPLAGLPECTPGFQNAVFERTKGSGAEVIKKKGGAGWAVGVAIREVIDCIALDRRRILPVSTLVKGTYGIRDVAISDSLSPRLEYVPGSCKADRNVVLTFAPNEAGSVALRWDVTGDLQPGQGGLISFQAKVR